MKRLRRLLVELGAVLGTALRGTAANRMRAALSATGIAIGVATLMTIYALTQGLTASFSRQIGSLGANTLYVTNRPMVLRGDWWRYRNRPPITRADVDALRRRADLLEAIAPIAFATAEAGYRGERMGSVDVRGTTAEYLDTATVKIERGRFLSPLEGSEGQPVAVIGAEVAERLFRGADPLGARLALGSGRLQVIGVLGPQGKAFGRSLDNQVIVPLPAFGRLFGERRGLVIAATARPEHARGAEEQVIEVLRRSRALAGDQDDTFSINRQSELVELFNQETQALFGVAIAVGLITLLVGGIGVMNIMLVAVTERTREIGVRRALGARRRTILMQFLAEASLVTLIGGALGSALGSLGAAVLDRISPLPAVVPPSATAAALVFSALIGLLFGTWPAYRAARLDPIESLRYE